MIPCRTSGPRADLACRCLIVAFALISNLSLHATPAAAQDVTALLVVDFGEAGEVDTARIRETRIREMLESAGEPVLTPVEVTARLANHLASPAEALDVRTLSARVEAGETAYFDGAYDQALESLTAPAVGALGENPAVLAADPERGVLYRRALLAAARVHRERNDEDLARGAMLASIGSFPTWEATTDWYPPSFVADYEALRAEALVDATAVHVDGPQTSCVPAVNGVPFAEAVPATVALPAGRYALTVTCEGAASAPWLVDVGEREVESNTARLDPALAASWNRETARIRLDGAARDDEDHLLRVAIAFGHAAEASRVVVVAATHDEVVGPALQWLEVDVAGEVATRFVRVPTPTAGEALDGDWLEAVRTGEAGERRRVHSDGTWTPAVRPNEGTASPSVAPWILLGVAGAAVVAGTALAVVEGDTFESFAACRDDAACAATPRLQSLRSSGRAEGTAATVSFAVAGAAVVTAVVIWLMVDPSPSAGEGDSVDDRLSLRPGFDGQRMGIELSVPF